MRVLIGTPIHEIKDYCAADWLKNVSELLKTYPADFLIVDNSEGLIYTNKLRKYCKEFGIKNFKIKHINCSQGMSLKEKCDRIETSQKFIRQYVISHNYDAWFSWECDQLIPKTSLQQLIKIMEALDLMVVAHNSWTRGSKSLYNMDMGVTLIHRRALEKHHWQGDGEEVLFKERVYQDGGNYANVYGLFDVNHIDDHHYLDDKY